MSLGLGRRSVPGRAEAADRRPGPVEGYRPVQRRLPAVAGGEAPDDAAGAGGSASHARKSRGRGTRAGVEPRDGRVHPDPRGQEERPEAAVRPTPAPTTVPPTRRPAGPVGADGARARCDGR